MVPYKAKDVRSGKMHAFKFSESKRLELHPTRHRKETRYTTRGEDLPVTMGTRSV